MLFLTTHEQMLVVDEYNRRFLYPSHGKGHDGVYFLQIGVTMVKVLPYWKYFLKCFLIEVRRF